MQAMEPIGNNDDLYFGPFRVGRVKRAVWRGDLALHLTPTEFEVLLVLAESRGHAIGAESLKATAWHGASVELNNVHQVIRRLRQKLGRDETGRDYIIRDAVGYVLAALVTEPPLKKESQNRSAQLGDRPPESTNAVEVTTETPFSLQSNEAARADPSSQAAQLAIMTVLAEQPKPSSKRLWVLPGSRLRLAAVGALAVAVLMGLLLLDLARPRSYTVPAVIQLTRDGRLKAGPLLFDGRRLWFKERFRGRWRVVSVSPSGGDVQPVDLPLKNFDLLDVGADGSALLVQYLDGGQRQLWSWPLAGGDPHLLPFAATSAAWSPDRHAIAYARDNLLTVVREGGMSNRMQLPEGTVVSYPRWSRDGTHIAFALINVAGSRQTLEIADPVSGKVQPIARGQMDGEDQSFFGGWTEDDHYIFSGCSTDTCDLWIVPDPVRPHPSNLVKPRRLTNRPIRWVWPSPGNVTGELFAMGEVWRGELVRLSQNGREWQPYLDPDGISAYELDHSRDGQWVTYIHYPDHRLWISRVNGNEAHQLAWPDFEAHQPHWSPDGKRIAFMGKPGNKWRVELVDVATDSGQEPNPSGDDQGVPSWVNDSLIVYGDYPSGDPKQVMVLHALDLQKKEATVIPGSEGLWTIRCSPDGKYLSALGHDSHGHKDTTLLISRWGSGDWRKILSGGNLTEQTWSHDSRWLYLTSDGRVGREVLRIDVLSGHVEKLADLQDFPATSEQWFGVAPDGSPLALRSVKIQEIYSIPWRP